MKCQFLREVRFFKLQFKMKLINDNYFIWVYFINNIINYWLSLIDNYNSPWSFPTPEKLNITFTKPLKANLMQLP